MATNTVDVYVKLPTGRTSQFDMGHLETVSKICDRVAKEEGVERNQVRLKYQGKVLRPNDTINYLGIRPETILKAEILESRPLTLRVCQEGGEEEELGVRSLDSLASLRTRVADLLHTTPDKVSITVWSRELSGSTVQDAGLSDGSKIDVSIRLESEVSSKAKAAKTSAMAEGKKEDDGPVDPEKLQNLISSFDTSGRRVEVAFSFDTTGSMSQYISRVRRKLRECCTRLLQDIPNIRVSLMAHGDYCDQSIYVINSVDLTSDAQTLVSFAENVANTTGGDSPECYEWVLRKAQQLDWGEDSAKALVVIGDAEPHNQSYTDQLLDWNAELDVLIGMGVKVYGVQPEHQYPAAYFYEALAERSGGCYLNLKDIDAITDMFLAVCYSEADDGQLEQFQAEMEAEGRMSEGAKQIFQRLEDNKTASTDTPAAAAAKDAAAKSPAKPARKDPPGWGVKWWNPLYDTYGEPEFCYNANTDTWSRKEKRPSTHLASSTPVTVRNPSPPTRSKTSHKKNRKSGGCVVM